MEKTFEFDPAAYRRLSMRWLLPVLAASLVLDALIAASWLAYTPGPSRQYFVNIGMGFLCLLNQGIKAAAITRYIHVKKRLAKCYLQTNGNQLVHYQFIAGVPRWRQASAAETILPRNSQKYFEWSETLYLKNVESLGLKRNGSIEVLGTNISKYSPDYNYDGVSQRTVTRHVIPACYNDMTGLYAALAALSNKPN